MTTCARFCLMVVAIAAAMFVGGDGAAPRPAFAEVRGGGQFEATKAGRPGGGPDGGPVFGHASRRHGTDATLKRRPSQRIPAQLGDIDNFGEGRRVVREAGVRLLGAGLLIGAAILLGWSGGRERLRRRFAMGVMGHVEGRMMRVALVATATSAALLAISGLLAFYGRAALPAVIGQPAFDEVASFARGLHGWLTLPFAVGLAASLGSAGIRLWTGRRRGPPPSPAARRSVASAAPPHRSAWHAAHRACSFAIVAAALALAVTGLSLVLPFELRLFARGHDLLALAGLAVPPGVTLWDDMRLTGLAHVVACLLLVAAVLARVSISARLQSADAFVGGDRERALPSGVRATA